MLHITVTSLLAVVVPRAGKIFKMDIVFLKEQTIFYQMVYTTYFVFTAKQLSEIVLQS